MSKPRDYSSQSYSPSGTGPAKSLPTNNKIDSAGKSREKDDMVGLNDKFVQLIDKVKHLEDENKKLDTKLKILKEQEDYEGNVDDIVKQLKNELEQRIEGLLRDQDKLQAELLKDQEEVEDTKRRYEKELQKKADLENDFVVTKKDVDEGHLKAVNLALELEDLMGKLDFLRVGYDEEIRELESQIQNKTVIIPDNSKRTLDMDEIIQNVKNQYANVAARSREEAEQWNQRKMDAMVLNAGQREQEVRDLKRDISDMLRLIQRLNGDLEALLRKVGNHTDTRSWIDLQPPPVQVASDLLSFLSSAGRVPEEGNRRCQDRRRRQVGAGPGGHRQAGGGLEAGQAGLGRTDPRAPRADEPEAGLGHRDRHLPQAAGGRGGEDERPHAPRRFLKNKPTNPKSLLARRRSPAIQTASARDATSSRTRRRHGNHPQPGGHRYPGGLQETPADPGGSGGRQSRVRKLPIH